MKFELPERCPICGASVSGGSSDELNVVVDSVSDLTFNTPIKFYKCGAKIYVSRKDKALKQYTIVFDSCERNKEEEK